MSRAERFEDEKRRIIDSCFSKLDQNGQLAESYITHIRITEDAQHPSSPPPPESPPEAKKPRLIIIAVRSTGRVRMHKARENNNGSFSIGKTWNLEELSAIESFSSSSLPPQSEKEAQYRSWAGPVGFTVTITKPYYWQAGTAKEKEFFIASTVKIYRKYTRGQVPELRGYDDAQKVQLLGAPPGQQAPPQGPPPMGAQPPPDEPMAPPQPPFAQRPQSREDSRYRGSPGPPPSMSDRDGRASGPSSRHESPAPYNGRSLASPPPLPTTRHESPVQINRALASPPSIPKPFASTEHLRSNSQEAYRNPRPGTAPGQGAPTRSPPPNLSQMPRAPSQQSSHSQLRSESPANLTLTSSRGEMPSSLQPGARSPPRKPSYQHSIDSVSEERQMPRSPPPPQTNGNGTGAALFQSTRERWQDQTHKRTQTPPQAPQLPPLDISRSNNTSQGQPRQDADPAPRTTESEMSSAGIDAGEAAAFAGLSGFMGADHSFASAPPVVQEPASPPTPERSKKRPPIESTPSDVDLRPAPLAQRREGSRNLSQTVDVPKQLSQAEAQPASSQEQPQAPPLSPTKNRSDSTLAIPGAFVSTPVGPTPLATPAETPTETPAEEPREEETLEPDEPFRPGLGPMIKKKAVADRFKRAVNTANAFKPRPGGAAEKILKAKAEREANGEPDGITGVVPRPAPKAQEQSPVVQEQTSADDLAVKEPSAPTSRDIPSQPPKVEVSSPLSPAMHPSEQTLDGMNDSKTVQLRDDSAGPPADEELQRAEDEEKTEQRTLRQPQIKVKRRSAQHERYLDELGIDRSLLADKGLDFETMLHDFGWKDAALSPKALNDMEADLRREQARLEAGAWLSSPSQEIAAREEREKQVGVLLDKAIQECDEMDGLLTIYGVELSTLNEDISYIEAQSQGLQVQAANQRTLHTELTQLVETLTLDRRVFEPLRQADLADAHGLEDAEHSLYRLYEAVVKIDPTVRANASGGSRPKSRGDMNEGSEVAGMRAVRQKREEYGAEGDRFCRKLMQHLDFLFTSSFGNVKEKVLLPVQGNPGMMRINPEAFTEVRRGLWVYSPVVLFAKELNRPAWQTLLRLYHTQAKPVYADAFGQNVAYWKRCLRKSTGEEADLLFTTQEKDDAASGSSLSSARKLTVKRSQTLAKTLRTASGEKPDSVIGRNTGSMTHSEVFSGAVDEMAVLLRDEQNFVVDFFHATSLETADFMEVVNRTPRSQRYGTNLAQLKPLDPDREMARQVTTVMSEIFGFFTNELSSLVEWSISSDPIQGVGLMACLTRHAFFLQDTSQEFLVQLVETLKGRLMSMFSKFVDEQVRAIEDTKVKIKKRRGVIGFMKTFPHFANAVENTFEVVGKEDYEREADWISETAARLDEAYDRINRAMFDSLKVIAKEGPGGTSTSHIPVGGTKAGAGGADDPEDKEMLNYHVLIIENMNHYISEVDDSGRTSVLAEWKRRATNERAEAMDAYVGQVVRRPLGKLLVSSAVARSDN